MQFFKNIAGITTTAGLVAKIGAIIFGIGYGVRCEIAYNYSPTSVPLGWNQCWVTAGITAGLPIEAMAEGAGFNRGFNTYNPNLRATRKRNTGESDT